MVAGPGMNDIVLLLLLAANNLHSNRNDAVAESSGVACGAGIGRISSLTSRILTCIYTCFSPVETSWQPVGSGNGSGGSA